MLGEGGLTKYPYCQAKTVVASNARPGHQSTSLNVNELRFCPKKAAKKDVARNNARTTPVSLQIINGRGLGVVYHQLHSHTTAGGREKEEDGLQPIPIHKEERGKMR